MRGFNTHRAGVSLGSVLGAACLLAGPALAQPVGATYPKSRASPDVAAWIVSDTPLQLPQVVDIGPSAVTAITSAAPTGEPRGFLANVASEALDPAIGQRENILSWRIPVEIDCERRAVRMGDMTGFSSRDLKSSPRVVRPADSQWVEPAANAPLGAVLRSMCDRDFKRPFGGGPKVADAARAKPEPPPGPPPAVVALKPPTKPQPLTEAASGSKKPPAESTPPAAATTEPAQAPEPRKAAAAKLAPAAVKHGTSPYIVQLGAAPSQDDAKGLLAHAQKRFGGELSGFKIDVVAANVAGKTVYRVEVSGFAGGPDANRLCAALKAGGQACFVRR